MTVLDTHATHQRAGLTPPSTVLTEVQWDASGTAGSAELTFQGQTFDVRDYRDRLVLAGDVGRELAENLGMDIPTDGSPPTEPRQCIVLAAVAAAMWAKDPRAARHLRSLQFRRLPCSNVSAAGEQPWMPGVCWVTQT